MFTLPTMQMRGALPSTRSHTERASRAASWTTSAGRHDGDTMPTQPGEGFRIATCWAARGRQRPDQMNKSGAVCEWPHR
jgi:hypothetical protein